MQSFVTGCFLVFHFVTEPTVHTTTFQFNQFWQQMTGVEVTGFSDAVKSKKNICCVDDLFLNKF